MIVERAYEVESLKAGGLDGLLHVHAELDDIQQDLNERLVLVVAARGRKHDEWLSVLEHKRGRERYARALAGLKHVRVAFFEKERLHPLAHQHARVARDNGGQPR